MRLRIAVAIVLATATCAAVLVEARPRLPQPTGSWAVGTSLASFEIGRLPAPVPARLWYPASGVGLDRKAPYLFGSRGLSLRDRFVGSLVRTDAFARAPFADGRFPVVIYVPGFGGRFYHNTSLAQELASHGYVVVALDDTEPIADFDYATEAGARASVVAGDRKVRLQVRDVRAVIDRLRERDATPGDVLAHRLALDRIGVLGFSFGGAVAAETAAIDERVRGAVDLDGSIYGTAFTSGVGKPFLFAMAKGEIESEDPIEAELDRQNLAAIERGLREHGGYLLEIDGMKHFNFTDTPILPSLRHTGVGTIDGRRGVSIVGRYVVAFFDRVLKGYDEPLLGARERVDAMATLRPFPTSR